MKNKQNYSTDLTHRENFLMSLLNRMVKEYKALFEYVKYKKPLKIVEILYLSSIPGETKFGIQLTNKNCVIQLSAADIINHNYNLDDFHEFHAEMIRHAVQGKLIEFLKIDKKELSYKIAQKKFDKNLQQHVFVIETKEKIRFIRTANELSKDKHLLNNLDLSDVYDVAFTQGSESILKEKEALFLAKSKLG